MAAKIGYSVIYATSNETGHDSTELEIRNNLDVNGDKNSSSKGWQSAQKTNGKGKGWQSARFCDYPQELVVALNGIYEISQIQILSHQSKIASKIEIWVGLDAENTLKHTQSTYKSMKWKRLGYLSLDKNERSNWKARELKSVYINTMANYIKFSLHESHINSINLFNQVGIVALGVLGKLSQHHQYEPSNEVASSRQQGGNEQMDILSDDPEIDESTAKKIRELSILKKQAVEQEDYDEAKRCKVCIENLQNSAKQLFHLEKQKQVAVQQEDYDTAKQLKLQIDRLRTMSLSANNSNNQNQHSNTTAGINYQSSFQAAPAMQPAPYINTGREQPHAFNAVLQSPAIGNISPAAGQPVAVPFAAYPAQQAHSFPTSVPHGQTPQQHHQVTPTMMDASASQPHAPPRSHSQSISMSPQHFQFQQQQQPPVQPVTRASSVSHPDERAIRPMQRNFNTMDVANIANPFGAGNPTENNSMPRQAPPKSVAAPRPKVQPEPMRAIAVNPSMNNNNNSKIGGNEDGGPPPLKAAVKKGSEKLIEIFGEYTICLINSPNWNHRDEGLKAVVSFVQKKEHPDQRQVFKLTSKMIYQLLQDRVASVQLTAIDTLNSVMSLYGDKREVEASEMCKALHSIIASLVNLLGHNNNRLVDSAGSTLISLCHLDELLCKTVYNVLSKKMKKMLPKHLKGRGLILLQLVPQFAVPRGCELNQMMDNLVIAQLLHKNGDIRDIGVQITTLLFQMEQFRNQIVQYLEHANLNDFIKETLNGSFQDATGHTNVLERDAKSIKEQSRPSRTMNRTSSGASGKSRMSSQRSSTRGGKRGRGRARGRGSARGRGRGRGRGQTAQHSREEAVKQQAMHEEEEEEEEEQEDVCNFCGLRDKSFVENEENLDLHYWQSCPMLTSCKLCEQVIEIATLHEHILTECESGIKHQVCNKCNIPFPAQQLHQHQQHCNENGGHDVVKCPLCLLNISGSDAAQSWKQHLLKYPGCKANPRPLLQ